MKKLLLVAAVCSAFVLERPAIHAQTAEHTTKNSSTGEIAVRQTESDLVAAYLKNNVPALDQIWADEYTFTAPNGLVLTKSQYLGMLRSRQVIYDSLYLKHMEVRMYGDTSVLRGQVVVHGRVGEHVLDGVDSYMTVYVKRDGRWQQIATLATRLPAAALNVARQ